MTAGFNIAPCRAWILTLAASALLPWARAADAGAAFHSHDRVLFQGDSITDGGRQKEGDDLNHIMGQDYAYLIAARIGAQLPERNVLFLNRGVGGDKIIDLKARWQRDTLDLKPDVLSILVGVNDASSAVDKWLPVVTVEEYASVYDALIREILAVSPHVRLVLCEPFALPGGSRTRDHWPERKRDLAGRRRVVDDLAVKYHAPVVHFQKVFDEACLKAPAQHWIWDGVHPTYAGHQLMADEWLRVFTAFYAGN